MKAYTIIRTKKVHAERRAERHADDRQRERQRDDWRAARALKREALNGR